MTIKAPVFEPTADTIDGLTDLAQWLKSRFMPSAVTCPCNGSEPSCARALEDPRVVQQADTVLRIHDHIMKLVRTLDNDYQEKMKDQARQAHQEHLDDAHKLGWRNRT